MARTYRRDSNGRFAGGGGGSGGSSGGGGGKGGGGVVRGGRSGAARRNAQRGKSATGSRGQRAEAIASLERSKAGLRQRASRTNKVIPKDGSALVKSIRSSEARLLRENRASINEMRKAVRGSASQVGASLGGKRQRVKIKRKAVNASTSKASQVGARLGGRAKTISGNSRSRAQQKLSQAGAFLQVRKTVNALGRKGWDSEAYGLERQARNVGSNSGLRRVYRNARQLARVAR